MESFHTWMSYAERVGAEVVRIASSAGDAAWPLAVLAVLAGLALLFAGSRLGPLLSGLAGSSIAWALVSRLPTTSVNLGVPAPMLPWVAATVAFVACAFVPVLYPAILGAVPGGIWGAAVPILGRSWAGAGLGAMLLGGVAIASQRVVLAATAAVAGAVLVDGALIALAPRLPALSVITSRPTLLVGLGAVLVIAGTAAQVAAKPAPTRKHGARRLEGRDE